MNEQNGIPPGSGGVLLWRQRATPEQIQVREMLKIASEPYFFPHEQNCYCKNDPVCVPCGVRLPAEWKGRF